jgi:acid stress-induced BolA-like protein IbaG/YrbA
MITAQELKNYITQGLPCDYVMVQGEDGQHFEAVIVSPHFVGKNMVQQHQMVYQVLGDRMRAEIHALSMRTFTPEAWALTGNAMTRER